MKVAELREDHRCHQIKYEEAAKHNASHEKDVEDVGPFLAASDGVHCVGPAFKRQNFESV